MNDFLYCNPTVFVIGNEYEILVNLNAYGLCYLKVGDQIFYEENSGVLPSERLIAKFRLPQKALNEAKSYSIIFRETDNRKSYYSTFKSPKTAEYSFRPLEKTENVHIYHVADVHYKFEIAKKTCAYFGDDTDLFVVNGDIGEVETVENYKEVCAFVGDISKGSIPVLFVRGNHDTRGRLSSLFTDYFPANGKNTYYYFEIGCLNGVALDCGEDKPDRFKEYDSSEEVPDELRGVNRFHAYRRRQLEFLKSIKLGKGDKIPFAVSHVCPMMTTQKKDSIFNIESEVYSQWNAELERMGVSFMICGHYHKAFILPPNDERNIVEHNYPVVVGSACIPEDFWGAAITLNKSEMLVEYTNKDNQVVESHVLSIR